ncbi:MAG: nitroreductase family protein [Anaerosomatales bacterium]|nr:nitroreductase family protein [Anaerosomatales bacterium]
MNETIRLMNETIRLMNERCSTRVFADVPVTTGERATILHAATRAPTAGNMMLYSIIEIEDQSIKDELALTCDDQPFIAKAPWVLIFLADYQKWTDLFDATGAAGDAPRRAPGVGDLMLACADALIAAQNAVIAAESLGIGSCYIGDVMENGERHAKLLNLPPHTFPVAMLCFGRPHEARPLTGRYEKHVVHRNRYSRLSADQIAAVSEDLQQVHAPHGLPSGADSYPEVVYRRKYDADFTHEMNRSVAFWIDRWQREDG